MMPPHEPGTFDVSVNTTGADSVPLIINLPPFSTTSALSPLILSHVMVLPASMVSVTPL